MVRNNCEWGFILRRFSKIYGFSEELIISFLKHVACIKVMYSFALNSFSIFVNIPFLRIHCVKEPRVSNLGMWHINLLKIFLEGELSSQQFCFLLERSIDLLQILWFYCFQSYLLYQRLYTVCFKHRTYGRFLILDYLVENYIGYLSFYSSSMMTMRESSFEKDIPTSYSWSTRIFESLLQSTSFFFKDDLYQINVCLFLELSTFKVSCKAFGINIFFALLWLVFLPFKRFEGRNTCRSVENGLGV